MKKRYLSFYYIILLFILQVLAVFAGVSGVSASVNDFEFESFDADYYLTQDVEGVSHLRVAETVVALFPEYRQNKGICRQIPFTNQDGANITLRGLSEGNIVVTRNGVKEPIYSIEKEGDYYNVCTGTDEYVLGRQVYKFEYEYERVVTEFPEYQELYWDTNGNGAPQRFGKVTARVHLADMDWWTGESWCYVGRYGENGQNRCTITKMSDGAEFVAENLASYENLTFDVELKPGSFVVPEPEKNWILMVVLFVAIGICGLLLIRKVKKYQAAKEKRDFYNGYFVKPEYQPSRDYDVAEMAEIYIGDKKDAKIAVMLNMIVTRRIKLVRRDKRKWALEVVNLDGAGAEEKTILAILNGGDEVVDGDTIEMKSRTATSKLVGLARKYDKDLLSELKGDGLVESKYAIGDARAASGGWAGKIMGLLMLIVVFAGVALFFYGFLDDGGWLTGDVVGELWFVPVFAVMVAALAWVNGILGLRLKPYMELTRKGLEMSRYMDGLKLYIGMAEAERMKFLQSVDGADVSADGVVKLYEKLLPYAAVFGLEKSWMNELEEYCKVNELPEPEWCDGFSVTDALIASRLMNNYVRSSTVMSSSGGGASSGFSGGGGGGFSGGGGGGGGFSGR
ncbi:DUF2207 domain-containing protein [Candidatus Saccharibacteria bacterium]|nr:DUF2207 domain-containing protein [Candidatus Saccharibacteria bacterium]